MTRRRSPVPVHGFTLVELLVVVLIIGILAAIALPRFTGQRTRAKNSAAQVAVRHALVAVRSWYSSDGKESYAGLCADASNARGENRCSGKTALNSLESSLGSSEPADTQAPGSGANPQDIWMGNGSSGTDPSGSTVTLCSVSKGDTTYCVKDTDGVASYYSFTGSGVQVGGDGSLYSASGWSSATPVQLPSNSALPTISGTAQQGTALSGTGGSWSGTSSSTAWSWQWRQCDSSGAGCSDIAGASGTGSGSNPPSITGYTPVAGDVGQTLRLQVSANNGGGSCGSLCVTATSAATAVVTSNVNCGGLSYSSCVLADSPVAFWRFQEAAGSTTATDSSGSGFTGTYSSATLGHTGATSEAGAKSMYINGNVAMSLTHNSANLRTGGGRSWSIEFWFKPVENVASSFPILINPGSGYIYAWYRYTPAWTSAGSCVQDFGAGYPNLNQWYHVVYTYDGSTVTSYGNGSLSGTRTSCTMNTNSSTSWSVGGASWSGTTGYIDDLAVYSTTLSSATVAKHYAARLNS